MRARVWALILLALLGGGLVAGRFLSRPSGDDLGPLHTVERGPLTISVVTAGTVQSRRTAVVRSQAEGRNTVIWIIDEGRTVTNNQLLVELDASALSDRRTDQQILVGNAESALIASTEKLAIARIERESSVSAAELKLQLARLEQEKYQRGEFPQTLQEQEGRIALAHEEVERASESLSWTQRLAEEGYLTRTELQADEMALKQKRISLETAITSLNVLTNYSQRQQQATLSFNVRQAEMDLERVQRQTRANVVQAESDLRARQLEVERQRSKLTNLEQQVQNCRIVAPTNGVVIYHSTMQASRRRWGGEPLQAGSTVVERQELIHIPVDGGMIVELSVPESSMTKLKLGQPARVKVDAIPGVEYSGRLSRIGLLPDGRNAWLNPDLQLYNCEIDLDRFDELRSGMNCETEMQIEHHEAALFVPVQCVIRVGAESAVYVSESGKARKRAVQVGLDNGRMAHILSGLSVGEQVLLNPPLEAGSIPDSTPVGDADATAAPGETDGTSESTSKPRDGAAGEPAAIQTADAETNEKSTEGRPARTGRPRQNRKGTPNAGAGADG
jgi:HlyD family secretion protein